MTMKGKQNQFGWIEACLHYGGEFGAFENVVYQQKFGLSEASASRHKARFARLFEDAAGREVFVKGPTGRPIAGRLVLLEKAILPQNPVFPELPTLSEWLQANLTKERYLEVEVARREPELWIIRTIMTAIKSQAAVRGEYHSKNKSSTKVISPHSIVRVVGRFHVRAYDHGLSGYFDYVMSRMTHVEILGPEQKYANWDEDVSWHEYTDLKIQYNSRGEDHTNFEAVKLDYGVEPNGVRVLKVKKAVVGYLIDSIDNGFEAPVTIKCVDEG